MAESEPVFETHSWSFVEYLEERLWDFNRSTTGVFDGNGLALAYRDTNGELIAGLAGHTWGGTCEVGQLWVRPEDRGRGLGRKLLQSAEQEARRRGCHQVFLMTHSFQAPGFYRKLGYAEVGRMEDYPKGHAKLTSHKALDPASS